MELPVDIVRKINKDFNPPESLYVLRQLDGRYENNGEFWSENVIRATLYIANGDLKRFEDWSNTDDWRTILIYAEKISGNYGHYFNPTFEEIDKINEVMEKEAKTEILNCDNLPPDLFENDFRDGL